MLSEQQCQLIENSLTVLVEPRKVGAYLCLHMGLTLAEVTALRWEDIDLWVGSVYLRHVVGKAEEDTGGMTLLPMAEPRILPMPSHVVRYLKNCVWLYRSGRCFILTGELELPAVYHMQNILTSIGTRYKVGQTFSATDLRNAFIRRCIQAGMDLYSLCSYIGIKQPNVIVKRFAPFFRPNLEVVRGLEQFGSGNLSPASQKGRSPKQMNLMILGTGSQGLAVRETAQALGVFRNIDFLGDAFGQQGAIGRYENYMNYLDQYPIAIPAFENGTLQAQWMGRLSSGGFILPTLVHPQAEVSPNAVVEEGSLVGRKAIVGPYSRVQQGCTISPGAVVEENAEVGQYSNIGSAATIGKGITVPPFSNVGAGESLG